jgi:hypothetical protein
MSRLLRWRAWSALTLLAGITSVWAANVYWLRLVCAAGLAIEIAQHLALLAFSIRMRMLGTFSVPFSAATMVSAGIACWYLANTPRLPFLVIAGLLLVLVGLWWFCRTPQDADVVQPKARNLPGVSEEPVDFHAAVRVGWSGDFRVSCTRPCRCHTVAASGSVPSGCSTNRSDVVSDSESGVAGARRQDGRCADARRRLFSELDDRRTVDVHTVAQHHGCPDQAASSNIAQTVAPRTSRGIDTTAAYGLVLGRIVITADTFCVLGWGPPADRAGA